MLKNLSRRFFFDKNKNFVLLSFFYADYAKNFSFWSSTNGNGLHKAIINAEKLVGYPTSFSSLKYLVDDEPTNFLTLAKKLVGSGHPLLQTARDLLSQDPHSSHQLGGLWVLLLSKAAHRESNNTFVEDDVIDGIHHKQRTLSETTELINTAFLIHRSMLDMESPQYLQDLNKKTLRFGNNLSVLGGDYLLAKASEELATLSNTTVVEMISQAIGDLAHGASLETLTNNTLNWNLNDWENYNYLLKGSLMANSCKAAMMFNEIENQIYQENAFQFGRNLVLAQQIAEDIEAFQSNKQLLKHTSIFVVMALQRKEFFAKYKNALQQSDVMNMSRNVLDSIKESSPNVLSEVRKQCDFYIEQCKINIAVFPHKESVNAINQILDTVKET